MGSRLRERPEKIFELFVEIARPAEGGGVPFILQKFPDDYAEEDVLKSIPHFAFPCNTSSSIAVDHFTFVLTDIESKFRFGFCRHAAGAHTCLCIISYLPWYEIYYKLLNVLAEVLNKSDGSSVVPILQAIYKQDVPTPGTHVDAVTPDFKDRFSFITPDPHILPSIPENRNLMEYYNAVDAHNMMVIFASMLYERRILITSKKLSRLTACIHGSATLIYPMYWQHLYIPVLPPHLIDYCSAPMPFLIGIHSSLLPKVQAMELGDAVVLDADTGNVHSEYDDLSTLPPEIVSSLKKRLKMQQSDRMKTSIMGDGVARAFLRALVQLIGGYRDALKFRQGEHISFEADAFITTRPPSMQPFLEQMLHLQIFEQFINDRLDMLNSGVGFTDEFELEANLWADKLNSNSKYKEWMGQMKKQGNKIRREGKEKFSDFSSKVKDKSKKAVKEFRSKIDDLKKKKVPTATLR